MNIAQMVKKASQQLTTVPVSVSTSAAGGAGGGGAVVGGGGGTKENLYVIALPPDQLRYFRPLQIVVASGFPNTMYPFSQEP